RLIKPFSRCSRCNGTLQDVDKQTIVQHLEPKTRKYYDTFRQCTGCGQIYWRGSHYERALRLVRDWRCPPSGDIST
ncbi:MAG: Mut7-C RNAse domain-containing protein, partial [Gammaproteobacteria bacterium]